MKSLAILLLAVGLSASQAKSQPSSPNQTWNNPMVVGALRNCLWGETVTKADDLRRASALGSNVEGALASKCGELSGAQWQCEQSGEAIEFCAAMVVRYAHAAIAAEMTRAGYAGGTR